MRNNYTKLFLLLVLSATFILLPACQEHEHVYGEWSTTVEATCVSGGLQIRTCSCGDEETKPISATGHSYGDWITAIEATCTSDGAQIRTCGCGNQEIKLINSIEHSYGEWITTIEATCVNEGVQTRICDCGDEGTMSISATGVHSYGEWVTTTGATCSGGGVQTRTCSCGAEETMSVSANDSHSYGNWVTTIAATCTSEGVQTRTCDCGAKETRTVSATEHSYGNWLVATAATCTSEGVQARTCSCGHQETKPIKRAVHKWKAATCTAPKTCAECLATAGSALEHTINCSGYCTGCGKKMTVDMKTLVGRPSECKSLSTLDFCFYQDSADQIKVCWGGQNFSGKAIASYSVTIYFYNADGQPAYSKITGQSSKTITKKEFVSPNNDLLIFEIIDRVSDCTSIVIGDITLEYWDGTRDTGWYGWGTKYKKVL